MHREHIYIWIEIRYKMWHKVNELGVGLRACIYTTSIPYQVALRACPDFTLWLQGKTNKTHKIHVTIFFS